MSKHIHIELTDDQHTELQEFKKRNGLTWKGVLLEGTKSDE